MAMSGTKGPEKIKGMQLRRRQMQWALHWILVLFLFLAACRGQEPPPPTVPPVATVNGEEIAVREFEKKLEEQTARLKRGVALTPEQLSSLKEEVLSHLTEEKVMLQRARELALTVDDIETEARIGEIRKDYNNESFEALFGDGGIDYPVWKKALQQRMLLEKVIAQDVNAKIQVTDGEAELYFKSNRKIYTSARRVRVAQIVIRDRDRAEGILKRLKAGEDFDKVARVVSIGPEAERGGDLGFFERGMMPDAIDRVVFALPVGKLSRVVRSPYGFHIFKVLEKDETRGRSFAEIKERVRADLRKVKEAKAYERWIEGMKAKADIRINRPLPDSPVLQPAKKATPSAEAGEINR
jgi:parvulin-like peptidyl-prolyl isomerase